MSKNKKPLLNEGTIRRMMRLAEIESLSDRFVGETYVAEEEHMDLDALDVEPEMADEPAEEKAEDEAEEAAAEGDEVTLSDDEARAALDALKAAEPLIDKLEAALGSDEAEEMDAEMDAPEMDGEAAEEEVEVDMEEPGKRGGYGMYGESEDSLYEAALKGLNIEIVEEPENATVSAEQLEEVKKAVYKRVVNRLLEDSKTENK